MIFRQIWQLQFYFSRAGFCVHKSTIPIQSGMKVNRKIAVNIGTINKFNGLGVTGYETQIASVTSFVTKNDIDK